MCGAAAAEILAHAAGLPVQEVGRLRGQAPIKPIPLGMHVPQPEPVSARVIALHAQEDAS
jgi:hypothetical protein